MYSHFKMEGQMRSFRWQIEFVHPLCDSPILLHISSDVVMVKNGLWVCVMASVDRGNRAVRITDDSQLPREREFL